MKIQDLEVSKYKQFLNAKSLRILYLEPDRLRLDFLKEKLI